MWLEEIYTFVMSCCNYKCRLKPVSISCCVHYRFSSTVLVEVKKTERVFNRLQTIQVELKNFPFITINM